MDARSHSISLPPYRLQFLSRRGTQNCSWVVFVTLISAGLFSQNAFPILALHLSASSLIPKAPPRASRSVTGQGSGAEPGRERDDSETGPALCSKPPERRNWCVKTKESTQMIGAGGVLGKESTWDPSVQHGEEPEATALAHPLQASVWRLHPTS